MDAIDVIGQQVPEYVDDTDPGVISGRWHVSDLRSADWALQRVAECEAEEAEVKAQLAAAIARLEARAAELVLRAQRGAAFFRCELAMFAERHRDLLTTGKKKSRAFVHGSIGWRSTQARLAPEEGDGAKAAREEWLLAQGVESGLFRLKVEPDMKALQEHFKATGEIPPGFTVVEPTETLTIKAEAPERLLVAGKE